MSQCFFFGFFSPFCSYSKKSNENIKIASQAVCAIRSRGGFLFRFFYSCQSEGLCKFPWSAQVETSPEAAKMSRRSGTFSTGKSTCETSWRRCRLPAFFTAGEGEIVENGTSGSSGLVLVDSWTWLGPRKSSLKGFFSSGTNPEPSPGWLRHLTGGTMAFCCRCTAGTNQFVGGFFYNLLPL